MTYETSNLKILHQGIDTLVIGVLCTDLEVFSSKFQSFIVKVKQAKERAQELKTFGEKYVQDDLGLGYGDFMVSSKGVGNYFGFCKNDDIFFSVCDAKFEAKSIYHLKIQFRSIFLLKYGHIYCMDKVKAFLNDIFEDKYDIKILRLDLCSDVTGIKYTPQDFFNFRSLKKVSNYTDSTISSKDDDLLESDEAKVNIVSLSDININNFMRFNRFEGISFGKSPHMFRIYDKIKQVASQNISTLIFTKWAINGFDIQRDLYVFRHEAEFGRAAIKKLLPFDTKDEVKFVFDNLGSFWLDGLTVCKWYDLTDKERETISGNSIQTDSIRKIYQRADKDNNRFKFWDFLANWNEENFNKLNKHDFLKCKNISQAKKALKSFVSAVYTSLTHEPNAFLIVLEEVKKDLEAQGLGLHEYGLSKLAGSFVKNEKIIDENNLDILNPLSSSIYFALGDFLVALTKIRDDEYKKPIKDVLRVVQAQNLED